MSVKTCRALNWPASARSPEQADAGHGGDAPGKVASPVPGQEVALQLPDMALNRDGLLSQGAEHLPDYERYLRRVKGHRGSRKRRGVRDAFGYVAEFDFRYNNRSKLGCEDAERADRALKGVVGKRLTYRPACEA